METMTNLITADVALAIMDYLDLDAPSEADKDVLRAMGVVSPAAAAAVIKVLS